jgi:hypothetical protein
MKIRKFLIPTIVLSIVLAIAAFGSDGLKNLFTTRINPAQAAGPSVDKPGGLVLVNGTIDPNSQTVSAFEFVPAPELPTRAPDAAGVFSGREGNTLTVQSFIVTTDGTQGTIVSGSAITETEPDGLPQAATVIVSGSTASITTGNQGGMLQPEAGSAPTELQGMIIIGQGELAPSGPIPAVPGDTSSTIMVGPGLPAQATTQKIVVTDATRLYHDVTPMSELPAAGTQSIHQVLEAGSLDGLTAAQSMVTVWGHMDGEQLIADLIVYQNPLPLK